MRAILDRPVGNVRVRTGVDLGRHSGPAMVPRTSKGPDEAQRADSRLRRTERGVPVIRASIDGFHYPRHIRYRRGRRSPEGYFRDSFNYEALTTDLLHPLGPGGSLRYRRAVFDYRADAVVEAAAETAPPRRDGSSPDVNAPENRRYVEGQELYLRECSPRRAATVVVNSANLASPEIIHVHS
jgi:uridine kinase